MLLVDARVRCEEVADGKGGLRLVPRVRLHDLRHTAASLLLAQGVPARVLMEVLGHSQIGVTMNICSHVMPTQLVQAASAMDQALWVITASVGYSFGYFRARTAFRALADLANALVTWGGPDVAEPEPHTRSSGPGIGNFRRPSAYGLTLSSYWG